MKHKESDAVLGKSKTEHHKGKKRLNHSIALIGGLISPKYRESLT
jgi:hypothetical protein